MLVKLMKQDLRATGRVMLPLYLAAIVLSALTRLMNVFQRGALDSRFWNIFSGITAFLVGVAIVALVIMTFVMMVWRFYKNYMTDEGYLMFTLPVRTGELIFSKLITTLFWYLCTGVVVLLSVLILGSGGNGSIEIMGIGDFFEAFTDSQKTGAALVGILMVLISGISGVLELYASMAIGQSFKKNKVFMMVVFFFVFSIAGSIVGSIFSTQSIVGASDMLSEAYALSADSVYRSTMHVLWTSIIVQGCWSVFYYFITHLMLSKRLNLQ